MCFSHSSFQIASSAFPAGLGTRSSSGVEVVSLWGPEFGGSCLALTLLPRFLTWSVIRQRVRFRSQALNEPYAGSALKFCMLLQTNITSIEFLSVNTRANTPFFHASVIRGS